MKSPYNQEGIRYYQLLKAIPYISSKFFLLSSSTISSCYVLTVGNKLLDCAK